MYIYDGNSTLATEIARLTGIIPDDVISNGSDIYISFISDLTETRSGFKIKFDAIVINGKNGFC